MKKGLLLRNGLLGLSLVAGTTMWANPIIVEAESPIELEQGHVSTLDAEGSEASGLAGINLDNAHRGSMAVYAFEAPEAGTYDLNVWYITMNTRWLSLQINDQIANLMECDVLSGGWNGVGSEVTVDGETGETEYRPGVVSKSIPVYCEKGTNFLTVKGIYGYCPEEGRDQRFSPIIDRFELTPAEVQIEKPRDWDLSVDRIERQCDNYDGLSGEVGIGDRLAFSNKRSATLRAAGGTISYNVNVPQEGVYLFEIWYSTMQCRWITVKVNRQLPHYVSFPDFSEGWGNDEGEWTARRQVALYLNEGANTITLGSYTKESGKDVSAHGDSPGLDYFTLDLVNYPAMTQPENEVIMYSCALSDIAKWSSDLDIKAMCDHNEYTFATASGNTATVTLEFPVPIYMSGYSYASPNDTEAWSVEVSADGESWTTVDYSSRGVNLDIVTCSASSGDDPVKFVRLVADGNEPAVIADFAVFGNMAEHPQGGMISAGFSDYETTHMGFDVGDWHEGIDKLFDGDPFTRFTVAQDQQGDMDDIKVTIYLPGDAEVKSYSLATHRTSMEYLSRAPKAWTLEAFDYDANDGEGGYVTVDARSDMNFVVPASTLVMDVENPVSSDCYVLSLKNRRNKATHLSDIQFYGDLLATADVAPVAIEKAVMVMAGYGEIAISATQGDAYAIYTPAGVCVAKGVCAEGNVNVKLASGLYIVKAGNRSVKTIVK